MFDKPRAWSKSKKRLKRSKNRKGNSSSGWKQREASQSIKNWTTKSASWIMASAELGMKSPIKNDFQSIYS